MYKILNYFLEKRISDKRVNVRKLLANDLREQEDLAQKQKSGDKTTNLVYGSESETIEENIQMIKERISVDDSYAKLINYFQNDAKRKYMINQNYLKFLDALTYLYKTSSIAVSAGIYSAPEKIYRILKDVKVSFQELEKSLALK